MKPDWNDAPEWANYVAMDADGEWFWFAHKPTPHTHMWGPNGGQCELASATDTNWASTLETRP